MTKRKTISQREARALKKRVEELESADERRRNCYASDWPGGVHIGSLTVAVVDHAKVNIARRLGHAVVCTTQSGSIQLYALPLGSEP